MLAGGAACVAYLALVLVFYREFISDIYPTVAETYVQVSFLPKILSRFALPYAAVMALGFGIFERLARDHRTDPARARRQRQRRRPLSCDCQRVHRAQALGTGTRADIILPQNNDIFWQKTMTDHDGLAPLLEAYRPLVEGWAMRVLIRKDYGSSPTRGGRPAHLVTRRSVKLIRPPFFRSVDVEG